MPKNSYILSMHNLDVKESLRLDFKSNDQASEIIKNLRLDDYNLIQYIQNEFLVELSIADLQERQIPIETISRSKKIWFGLSKKEVNDILIFKNSDFMYPYTYGHFVYYFSKNEIDITEISAWLSRSAPNRFTDFDDIYSAMNNYNTQLIHEDDYLIVTNYDLQTQFGISGRTRSVELILKKIKEIGIEEIEYEQYKQPQGW